jgi:leucine-rich repeat protein SHOC2
MERVEVEKIIEAARCDRVELLAAWYQLPWWDKIKTKPDSLATRLSLRDRQITTLPESIGNLHHLRELDLSNNRLTFLPESLANLTCLQKLDLSNNQLTALPNSLANLTNLVQLSLDDNPLTDLSILKKLPNLSQVSFFHHSLYRRYWTKLSEWKLQWLRHEHNAELRRILIEQIGYEKISEDSDMVTLDNWREYTLLKIDAFERIFVETGTYVGEGHFETEPMVLLKMTCPSTGHIHILRVPPELMSAEAAITWVNHGIHPDKFTVQT